MNIKLYLTIIASIAISTLGFQAQATKVAPPPIAIDEWKVNQVTWSPKTTMRDQFKNDIVIFYNTLFPDPEKVEALNLDEDQKKSAIARQEFLKRLIVILTDLKYTTQGNNTRNLKPWEWPLAAAIGHGGRIVVDIKRNGTVDDVYNLLLSGNSTIAPTIDACRPAASHAVVLEGEDLNELKLGAKKIITNLRHGRACRHIGVDLPIGGVGNASLNGDLIGPVGDRLNSDTKKPIEGLQQGHLYIFATDLADGRAGMLFGLEGSRPQTSNDYGGSHSIMSGFKSTKGEKSPTGGQKFELLMGDKGPAKYGGMWLMVDEDTFQRWTSLFQALDKLDPAEQQALFKELLTGTATQGQIILEKLLEEESESKQ